MLTSSATNVLVEHCATGAAAAIRDDRRLYGAWDSRWGVARPAQDASLTLQNGGRLLTKASRGYLLAQCEEMGISQHTTAP